MLINRNYHSDLADAKCRRPATGAATRDLGFYTGSVNVVCLGKADQIKHFTVPYMDATARIGVEPRLHDAQEV